VNGYFQPLIPEIVAYSGSVQGGQGADEWKKYKQKGGKKRVATASDGTRQPATSSDKVFKWSDPWKNFPTEPPIYDGDDGFSGRLDGVTLSKWRAESRRGAGNAIVPQVALQIFKTIEKVEEML
jgi:hypothetical protein